MSTPPDPVAAAGTTERVERMPLSSHPGKPGRLVPRRIMLILGSLSAFGPLTMDLYLPALPRIAADLGGTDATVQLTLSACTMGLALGQLLVGPLSDRFGRRVPLLVGLAVYAAASVLCALAPDMRLLIGCRLLQGLAGGAGIVIARAVVRDLYDTETAAHVFSMLVLVSGLAPILAPVVGGQLLRVLPWPGLFVALSGIGCALLAAVAWGIRETHADHARSSGGVRETVGQFAIVLRDHGFLGYTAVLALGCSVLFIYIFMSPFVFQHGYGLSAQSFSLVFACNAVGLMVAGRLSAALVRRHGAARALRVGLSTGAGASVALLFSVALGAGLLVLLPVLLVAVSSAALIMPNATALGLDAQGPRAGTAAGLMGLAQFGLSGTLAPLVSLSGATALSMSTGMVGAAGVAVVIERLVSTSGRPVTAAAVVPRAPEDESLPETVD